MAKNKRQAYSVNVEAGHQHSAESWGTGRAVSRIPRVSGGGTSRAGQAAFGNMCRKGRMFAPTKTWRKWHRRINTNQKRFAVASALAASALPSLVLARGHQIEKVPEIPLVVDTAVESLQKTKQAIATLKAVGAYDDVIKAKESRKLRRGKGKLRDRRHVARRGPLIVYNEDQGIVKAFRNLPGVELSHVDGLNLLQLAPGGHLGRFIIWTKSAFTKLNDNWGSVRRESKHKKNYTLPQPLMANSDLTRLINSDEVQSKVRPAIKSIKRTPQHKNPLTNLGVKVRLNPYALNLRRAELQQQERRKAAKAAAVENARKGIKPAVTASAKAAKAADKKHAPRQKENFKRIVDDSLYVVKSADADPEFQAKRKAAIAKASADIAAKKFVIKTRVGAVAVAEPEPVKEVKKEVKKPAAGKEEKKAGGDKKEEKKRRKESQEINAVPLDIFMFSCAVSVFFYRLSMWFHTGAIRVGPIFPSFLCMSHVSCCWDVPISQHRRTQTSLPYLC
jgi:large subunit ribosomal protein L4e